MKSVVPFVLPDSRLVDEFDLKPVQKTQACAWRLRNARARSREATKGSVQTLIGKNVTL